LVVVSTREDLGTNIGPPLWEGLSAQEELGATMGNLRATPPFTGGGIVSLVDRPTLGELETTSRSFAAFPGGVTALLVDGRCGSGTAPMPSRGPPASPDGGVALLAGLFTREEFGTTTGTLRAIPPFTSGVVVLADGSAKTESRGSAASPSWDALSFVRSSMLEYTHEE
jgi:hypothetical protein